MISGAIRIEDFDQYRVGLVLFKINEMKDSLVSEETNHIDWIYKGIRFNDNKAILVRLLSKIHLEEKSDLEKTKAKFLSLNSEEIVPYIKWAVLDAASADYYYTFEKDWG